MYSPFNKEKKTDIPLILGVSAAFHLSIILVLVLIVALKPEKESPPPIPFFEMVQVAPPPPPPAPPAPKVEEPPPPPPPEIEQSPTPVPEPKPDLKPEPKPETPKPTPPSPAPPTPAPPVPEPTPPSPNPPAENPKPSMDMPMDLPSDIKQEMEMPALRMLGNVAMDPQLQAYLDRLVRLLYQNFNPPSGTEILRGTKSSVQFQIARNGEIEAVVLRQSSGNSIWDRLAVRAVQITKPPPLPPSFTADNLPLIFDFREK